MSADRKPRHLCRAARLPGGWRRARALVGAWRSFVEHFGMRGTVTDAWEPATSTQDYRGLGRVGIAAGYSLECVEGAFQKFDLPAHERKHTERAAPGCSSPSS